MRNHNIQILLLGIMFIFTAISCGGSSTSSVVTQDTSNSISQTADTTKTGTATELKEPESSQTTKSKESKSNLAITPSKSTTSIPAKPENPGIVSQTEARETQAEKIDFSSSHSANPCISLPPGGKERCEESFKQNPNLRPENDANYGKADPNARLATDEVDYSNVYVDTYDQDNLPKIASYNFSELDKYSRMSKIRSAVGHDFSYNTPEYDATRSNCKSMKHYFVPMGVPKENAAYQTAQHTFEWMSIKFFAPVDGRIVGVYYTETEYGTEANFTIASSEYPGYFFMFFHVALDPDLKQNSVVKAGQLIGTLGSEEAWGEIVVSIKIGPKDHRLVSFLDVATDEVVMEYKARGFKTVSDVIVTKEQRDANPLKCDNSEAGWFHGTSAAGTENTVFTTWVFESKDNWFFFDE